MAETAEQKFNRWVETCNQWASLQQVCNESPCVKDAVVAKYKEIKQASNLNAAGQRVFDNFNPDVPQNMMDAANVVWRNDKSAAINILNNCAHKDTAAKQQNSAPNTTKGSDTTGPTKNDKLLTPFDRRLDRVEVQIDNTEILKTPMCYDSKNLSVSTTGYTISQKLINERLKDDPKLKEILENHRIKYQQMINDPTFTGVPAIQNPYAIIRLFNADGGSKLLNQRGERRWYEVDSAADQQYNYASAPTTSAIISWGSGDPNNRTPYLFTDFVFCKYWKKIENNRMITLRRYPAPALDNLNFAGMTGFTNMGTQSNDKNAKTNPDGGSTKSLNFMPMSTAVTYFGGDTGNNLTNIIKFTTGMNWGEVQGSVWEVTTSSTPDNKEGPGKLFGGLAKFSEMLNIFSGNVNNELIMNQGQLPPDPYENGPYENRIKGPVNRIDKVKKRDPGLDFKWDGLNLVFEYVGRPVGGINPKAVLLDIMSNFLVMGSASAVFFGGAHRFMTNPAQHPFPGSMKKWYEGKPLEWATDSIASFTKPGNQSNSAASGIIKSIQTFFDQLLSGEKGSIFGAATSLFTGAAGSAINNVIAQKTAGQVPYLTGLKSILTGEPVGEWHVTIGNPLNPIAMIGNLICKGMTVEFNEELGPDDFPTEMKITVQLEHGMARDRDAIESVFNRGMGRIYALPDNFLGANSDFQTAVDQPTKSDRSGTMPGGAYNIKVTNPKDQSGRTTNSTEMNGTTLKNTGEAPSVWTPIVFKVGISENANEDLQTNEIFRSSYRASDWIAQRALI